MTQKRDSSNHILPIRCAWAGQDPLMCDYHDNEWGVPEFDSRALWEKLMLDGFQAGLSWITVLRKRAAFREAFHGFDPRLVAAYDQADVERLLQNSGIIRSRAKIQATIGNARAYLSMQDRGEDFSDFVWAKVGAKPLLNTFNEGPIPAKTALSEEISRALKSRGFKFTGPTIVYAWMQATGLVNDHSSECFRHPA